MLIRVHCIIRVLYNLQHGRAIGAWGLAFKMAAAVDNAGREMQGWGQFFEELDFLPVEYDSANEDCANYVMEKLEVCIIME